MAKQPVWAHGKVTGAAKAVNDFQSSIRIDSRMFREDIMGSIAHAYMLGQTDVIAKADAEQLIAALQEVLQDIENGTLAIDPEAEDIHSFIEGVLTERLGDIGKTVHTARSRNDQVALDTRLYLLNKTDEMQAQILTLIKTLTTLAAAHTNTVMPGYTHLQAAQPISFAHHMLAYTAMLMRDYERMDDCKKRMRLSPLGSAALAGTTIAIDRQMTAERLHLDGACFNSLDGVSDRDFCIELSAAIATLMMHLSRFSEEIVLWNSQPFGFITLDKAYSTGSSIMPQKKNPDVAELVRGKTGRCYGNLMSILTVMKALPLAYNKDMQEDKEGIFDSVDTVLGCLPVFTAMLATMQVNTKRMREACASGFLTATDCADYLVKYGVPFRDAYGITKDIIEHCIEHHCTLDSLTLEAFQAFHPAFQKDVYQAIDLDRCMQARQSYGGAGTAKQQIELVNAFVNRSEKQKS